MTGAVLERADRGLLAALAIAFDEVGVRDRPSRLAYAALYVGRPLASTSELAPDEARELRRYLRRHRGEDGVLPDLIRTADERRQAAERTAPRPSTCACTDGGRPGQPSACDPAGSGRYCPPAVCWCGSCPWWAPAPPPNYAAAIAKLAAEKSGAQ
ncbi:hypothetical protein [Blastococcus sp. TF02A-26]|uniref:hypothetical protein n=1 Tax=Blastococcus sp. TF02A-26 TaxID=2250577 RepID=UPI000DEA5496|nr:hypothetical protein [Blastococcus sp. TF02A-26]RBY82697.1 hypothetical protein DQ240_18565 [Blastococcus sp. TF02A-26]